MNVFCAGFPAFTIWVVGFYPLPAHDGSGDVLHDKAITIDYRAVHSNAFIYVFATN